MHPRIPHPLSLAVLALMLVVVVAGLAFGIPAYQQWSAVKEIQQYGYVGDIRPVGVAELQRALPGLRVTR